MSDQVYGEKILTPPFRVIFPTLFDVDAEREQKKNGKEYKEYSVNALFNKSADLKPMLKSVHEVATEKWRSVPKNLKNPFKNGSKEKDLDKYPYYENTIYIRFSSYDQPGIVDGKMEPVIDKSQVYSGCWARATVVAKTYGGSGTGYQPGVSFKLQNIQILPKSFVEQELGLEVEDSALTGRRSSPNEDFDGIDFEADDPANYETVEDDIGYDF